MSRKMSFREFLGQPHGGNVSCEGFALGAADGYELYSYLWDTLRFRQGGLWNLWKTMPLQTYSEMAADWSEANPQYADLSDKFFHPDLLKALGFNVTEDGLVTLPIG